MLRHATDRPTDRPTAPATPHASVLWHVTNQPTRSRNRYRSCSRHRSRNRYRSCSRHRSRNRYRSCSRYRSRNRYRSCSRYRSRNRYRSCSRYRSRTTSAIPTATAAANTATRRSLLLSLAQLAAARLLPL